MDVRVIKGGRGSITANTKEEEERENNGSKEGKRERRIESHGIRSLYIYTYWLNGDDNR